MFPADVVLEDSWRVAADDLMLAVEGGSQQRACRHDCIIRHHGTFQQHTLATNPHMVAHQNGFVGIDAHILIIV